MIKALLTTAIFLVTTAVQVVATPISYIGKANFPPPQFDNPMLLGIVCDDYNHMMCFEVLEDPGYSSCIPYMAAPRLSEAVGCDPKPWPVEVPDAE